MHTIFFDIDGTLLHSGGAGQAGIERALEIAFGITAPTDGIPTAGRTDRAIAADLMRYHGISETEAAHSQLWQAYLSVLPEELAQRNGIVYPGVRELLSQLSHRKDVRLGLLTGNYREAAWLKLRQHQLAEYFRSAFGGYGDEHSNRDDVARQALVDAQSRAAPDEIDSAKLWVIGDTPADVQCGRAIGARVIAVATGMHSREQLTPTEPDHLFDHFGDVAAVLSVWS